VANVFALNLVLDLGEKGFRNDLIESAITFLQMEVSNLLNGFQFGNDIQLIDDYEEKGYWREF
jgi:hypothetical protein